MEPATFIVDGLRICEFCLDGKGGECHSPGCVLFLSKAPDIPLREKIVLFGGSVRPERRKGESNAGASELHNDCG